MELYLLRKTISIAVLGLFFYCAQDSWADEISIEARIDGGTWRSATAIEPVMGQAVLLRVEKIEGASIQWFQIVPDINIRYNNAVWPWLPNAYKWKGFDDIKYSRIPLRRFGGKWVIHLGSGKDGAARASAPPLEQDALGAYLARHLWGSKREADSFSHSDIGTFWFQAEVVKENQTWKTPGIESKDHRGISPDVFRVSIKQDDGFMGNLTSYFNVPAVFGSTPYQVKNHIGVDCADVLMAAYCKAKNMPITKDYNVAMLTSKFKTVARSRVNDGEPDTDIHWQEEVRVGDFIAVKYHDGGQYQHIGALYGDHNKNGILDGEDLILHAGPDPLHLSKIKSGVFDGTVVVLRNQ